MTLENFIKNEHCPKILVNYYNYITIYAMVTEIQYYVHIRRHEICVIKMDRKVNTNVIQYERKIADVMHISWRVAPRDENLS